jgi:hypothetical protein
MFRFRRSSQLTPEPRRLLAARRVIGRWRADGGDGRSALRWTLRQVEGLRTEVDDPARWKRLSELVARTGDPWNADDWPDGFDALLCCVPLCHHVDYECKRCPVGKQQASMSCAHPTSAFGRLGELVRAGDRDSVRQHLDHLESLLRELQHETGGSG